MIEDGATIDALRRYAIPLDPDTAAGPVLELIDPAASVVLIGETTHGTFEEPGTLERVAQLARAWCMSHLPSR